MLHRPVVREFVVAVRVCRTGKAETDTARIHYA
jgi:hypothetical protein